MLSMTFQHRKTYRWRFLGVILLPLMWPLVNLQETAVTKRIVDYDDHRATVPPGKTAEMNGFDELNHEIHTGQVKVLLQCDTGRMIVNTTFFKDFSGIVYAEHNENSECRFSGTGSRFYSMIIPLRNCSTNQTSYREFRNEIVVHFETDPDLIQYADEVFTLICRYSPPVDVQLPPVVGVPVTVAGASPLTFWEILLIICAILFLALLFLGLCCAYYCLKKRRIKIVRRPALSTAPGSVMTKLSGSTLAPLSLFDGIRIPRANVNGLGSNSIDNALLANEKSNIQYNQFQSNEIASDYPSESPSSRFSDIDDVDMTAEGWHKSTVASEGLSALGLAGAAMRKGYENKGFEYEEESSLEHQEGLNIMDLNHSIPKIQGKGAYLPTIEENNYRNSNLMQELQSVTKEVMQRRNAPVPIDEWIPQNQIIPVQQTQNYNNNHSPYDENSAIDAWNVMAPVRSHHIKETEERIITEDTIETKKFQMQPILPPPLPPPQPKTEIREEIITEEFVDTTYTTHTRKYIPPVYNKIRKKQKEQDIRSISDTSEDSALRRMIIPSEDENETRSVSEMMENVPQRFAPPPPQPQQEFHTKIKKTFEEEDDFTLHTRIIPPPPTEAPPPPPPPPMPQTDSYLSREYIHSREKSKDLYENISLLTQESSVPNVNASFRVISPPIDDGMLSPDVTAAFRVIPPNEPEQSFETFREDNRVYNESANEMSEYEKWSELIASNGYHMFTSDVEKQNLDGVATSNIPDVKSTIKKPINWDVIFRILEPPATRYKTHIKPVLSPEDVEKLKSLIRNDNQFRVMVENAVNVEDIYKIRYHENYSNIFDNHKWEVIIKIITNALQIQDKPSEVDMVSETRSISEAEFMNKSIVREPFQGQPTSPTTTVTSHADDRAISEAEFVNKSMIRDDILFDSPSTTMSRDSIKSAKFAMQESDITETYISHAKESLDGTWNNQNISVDPSKSPHKSLTSDHDSLESSKFLDNEVTFAYELLEDRQKMSSTLSSADLQWSNSNKDKPVKLKPSLERSSTEFFENIPTLMSPGIKKPTAIRPTLERSSTEIIMNPRIVQEGDKEETKSISEKQVHDWHKY